MDTNREMDMYDNYNTDRVEIDRSFFRFDMYIKKKM